MSSRRYKLPCVPIEDSDQPAHMHSLIWFFNGHSVDSQGPISKWVWSRNTTITQRRPTHGTVRKSHRTFTVTRHQYDNNSKATSSLFLFKMITKLKRTQSNAQQNKDNIVSRGKTKALVRLDGCADWFESFYEHICQFVPYDGYWLKSRACHTRQV